MPVLLKSATKKRNLFPESRARIAEAVKRRWAKQKLARRGRHSHFVITLLDAIFGRQYVATASSPVPK
jgi:hypothetical protein